MAALKYKCGTCADTGFARVGRTFVKCTECPDPEREAAEAVEAQKAAQVIETLREAAAQVLSANMKKCGVTQEVYDALKAATWSEFAQSLTRQLATKAWSPKQVAAANSMAAKIAAKAAAPKTAAPVIDLTRIATMFDAARASGYKAPKYRAEGLRLTAAPMFGANPGAIYVKDDATGTYYGKLVGKTWRASRDSTQDVVKKLLAIAADPKAAAIKFGQRTGRCSCCGRELTKEASIEAGIGPVCAQKWGI